MNILKKLFCFVIALGCLAFAQEGKRIYGLSSNAYVLGKGKVERFLPTLRKFVAGGWNETLLHASEKSRITMGPWALCTFRSTHDYLFGPYQLTSLEGGTAAIFYQGTVSPPASGWYRFVGTGEDLLVVEFGGKIVLDAGYVSLFGRGKKNGIGPQTKIVVPGPETWNRDLGGLTAGPPVYLEQGNRYSFKSLYVNSSPEVGFCLLVQRLNNEKEANKKVLKLKDGESLDMVLFSGHKVEEEKQRDFFRRWSPNVPFEWIPHNKNSAVWPVWTGQPNASLSDSADDSSMDEPEEEEEEEKPSKKKKKRKRGGRKFRAL